MGNMFREFIQEKNRFVITWELVPGRGARESSQEKVLDLAQQAAKGRKVHAVSLTDNPGGNSGIQAEGIGREIADLGLDTIIHLTCKDKNRNQLESQLYALERVGLENLLVMTGDFALEGINGRPKPVFDFDSTHLMHLVSRLNQGLEYSTMRGKARLQPCNFFSGVAVSPFKATEAEQRLQYSKLSKKIANGAQFVMTQVGYDARKFHELILFMKKMNWQVPVIGNIYVLTYPVGRIMNQNRIPGCVVTDKLAAQLEKESQSGDKGKQASLERAAKQYALLKGIGCKGVHLGGANLTYPQIDYIISRGEELSADWEAYVREFDYGQDQGFYLFAKDEKTGLNRDLLPQQNGTAKRTEITDLTEKIYHGEKTNKTVAKPEMKYKLSRQFHQRMFVPGKTLFGMMQKICARIENTAVQKYFHGAEHASKVLLYHCQDCGDCALTDTGYVCPMGDCPKNQRNGPCEGSYYGWCEVYPNQQKCIWVKAYERLQFYGEEDRLNAYQVEPYNWKLDHTSSWANYFLGRDHSAKRLNITWKDKKENADKK